MLSYLNNPGMPTLTLLSPPWALSPLCSVGSLLGVAGGAAGAMSYHLYDGKDMGPFRSFCLGAAAVSCLGFWWTGTRLDLGRLDAFKREVSRHGSCRTLSVALPRVCGDKPRPACFGGKRGAHAQIVWVR